MKRILIRSLVLTTIVALLSLQVPITKTSSTLMINDLYEIKCYPSNTIFKIIASSNNMFNKISNNTLIIKQLSRNITSIKREVNEISKDISKLEATIGGLDERVGDIESEMCFIHNITVINLGLYITALLIAITALIIARRPGEQKVAGKIKKRRSRR